MDTEVGVVLPRVPQGVLNGIPFFQETMDNDAL